jgi:NAD(P)-dependent dehydrogenase (short-subunit alcohol dehydrogenase family)
MTGKKELHQRPVALVTGSSRGIGRATALLLARRGFDVAVHYRREAESAEAVAKEVEAAGGQALVVAADLAEAEAVRGLVAAVGERFGRLDALVANAASTVFRPLLKVEVRHLELTWRTVVQSFFLLVQGAVPLMAGRPGTVVAISGIDTIRVMENHGLLATAKAALEQLVRYLAVELAAHDVAVNGVMPGFVGTDSSRHWGDTSYTGGSAAMTRDAIDATPAGRVAEPDDIAEVVAFLCSPPGRWLRGQTLVADGGITLR